MMVAAPVGAAYIVYRNLVVVQYQYSMEPWQLNEDNDGQEQPLGLGGTKCGGALRAEKEKRGAEPRSTKGK